ncbi:MAG: acyltransferase [Coriobacteriia bacterium]|nr:acyltransferase [Coriobacteriia bacterium]
MALGSVARSGRDARIDALKGVAIVCVVLYHTLGQYWITAPTLALYLREIVFAFMLPLFAFLSGYVQPRAGALKPRQYFSRRTLGLMVPYVCWEVTYGLALVPGAHDSIGAFGRYLLGTLTDPHLEGRMWYLYILWVALMLLGALRVLGRDNPWVLAASIVAVMVWPWWGQFKRLQWIYTYVVLGLLARRYDGELFKHRLAIGLAGAVAFPVLWWATRPEKTALARVSAWLLGSPLLGGGVATLYGLSTLAGVAAIAALVAASYVTPHVALRALAVPGKLSLGIYVVHFYFVEVWHEPSPWLIPVIVAVALACSMAVTLVLARWRVSATLLLGERWTPKSLPLGDVKTETL